MMTMGLGAAALSVAAGIAAGLFGLLLLRWEVAALAGGKGALSAILFTLLRFGVAGIVFFLLARLGLAQALAGLAGYTVTVLAVTMIARVRHA